jgi:hypothetical protein
MERRDMSSQVCGNCRHWDAGLCLRFPPVIVPPGPYSSPQAPLEFVFPETDESMTCGEWSPKGLGAVVTYTVATDELIERRDG